MSADFNATRVLVIGNTGCGKTRFSKQILRSSRRLIFVDPLQEWGEECQAVLSWEEFFEIVREPEFRICLWIEHDPPSEMIDVLVDAARSDDVRNCTLAIDELSLFFDSRKQPSATFEGLFRFGRRQGVNFWGISQRYVDCPLIARSQSTHLVAFRTHEQADIERLKAMVGKSAVDVETLLDGEYLEWDLRNRGEPRKGKVREFQQHRGNYAHHLDGGGVREPVHRAPVDSPEPVIGDESPEEEGT